jgi:Protein of unknown function (DUF4238)
VETAGTLHRSLYSRHTFAVPRDHYLPAVFISRFAEELRADQPRKSFVHVATRSGKTFRAMAEDIAHEEDLYAVSDPFHASMVDDTWKSLEGRLTPMLQHLVDPSNNWIDLRTWLGMLVPLVASFFVRGVDFAERFERRAPVAATSSDRTGTNVARLIEIQRLLAPVMCARWVVLHRAESGIPFITNDLGVAPTTDLVVGQEGWSIPLTPDVLLGVFPSRARAIGVLEDGSWRPVIQHHLVEAREAHSHNEAVAAAAQSFVLGPTRSSVETMQAILQRSAPIPVEAVMELNWAAAGTVQAQYECEWSRLMTALDRGFRPADAVDFSPIDLELMSRLPWRPPIAAMSNGRRSTLSIMDNLLIMRLAPWPPGEGEVGPAL